MRHGQQGFTVLELVITFAVMGVLASVALIGFSNVKGSFDKNEARHQLEADLKVLRNTAIEAGARAFLIINSTGTSYSVALDYAPYGTSPTPERIVFSRTLPPDVVLSTNSRIMVSPKGFTVNDQGIITASTITLRLRSEPFFVRTLYPTGVLV